MVRATPIRWLAPMLLATLFPGSPLQATGQDDQAMAKACPAGAAWIASHQQAGPTVDGKPQQPKVRHELDQRYQADQDARNVFLGNPGNQASQRIVMAVDQSNHTWLQQQLAGEHFVTVKQVGRKGVMEMFLLVQHADSDPALQARVLAMMKPLLASGDVRREDYALLTDRVLLAQHHPQRYGSQMSKDAKGKIVLSPVEDPAHLDARRASMNLLPEADYQCVIHFMYHA